MSTPFNKVVACNVRFLRQEKRLTTEELASLAYMASGTVSNIENANRKRDVDRNYIEQIARALGVPSDVLTEENFIIRNAFSDLRKSIINKDYSDQVFNAAQQLLLETANRGPRERVNALLVRGTLDYRLGRYTSASDYYEKALQIAERIGDYNLLHKTRYNLAAVSEQNGNYERAHFLLSADLDTFISSDQRARNYQLLGKIFTNQRLYENAERSFKSAIEEIRSTDHGCTAFEAKCFQLLGELYREIQQYDTARKVSETAIQLAKDANDELCGIYAKRTVILTFIDQGDRISASKELDSLLSFVDTLNVNQVEYDKTMFYFSWCHNDYPKMVSFLNAIEKHDVQPREFASMCEKCGEIAMQDELFHDAERFYKKAIRVLMK